MAPNIKIDHIKLNHWLNARKTTLSQFLLKNKSLKKKINLKKNFLINNRDASIIEKFLNISIKSIEKKARIPEYIFWKKEKILRTKRPINRDGIHFYNYYSLPAPDGFIGPVILDILCPKNKLPKLNNGHLEQAITVNLGPEDIFGRWGKKKNKLNFSKIKYNKSNKHTWVIGDTYVEPAYCPHSYSRATDNNSRILSYTSKSPIEKLVKQLNNLPNLSSKKFIGSFKNKDNLGTVFDFYLSNRFIDYKFISKFLKRKINSFNQLIKNKHNFTSICDLLDIDSNIFLSKKNKKEDKVGKTYLSINQSIKTARRYKSYTISSMASSPRYPDLFGVFIKVNKINKKKDLFDYTSSHYLVTGGSMKFNINNKSIHLKKDDALWVSPFLNHGFSGEGSLIKISNGECLGTGDFYDLSKTYDIRNTIKRSYKDVKNWGYN